MSRKKGGIPGLSFSWKRALGISAAKGRISRQLGVPLTRKGRQRKMGSAAGCCVPAAVIGLGGLWAAIALVRGVALVVGGGA